MSFLIPNPDGTTGSTAYFFGDSITVGVGASVQSNRWTSLLSSLKGWVENNNGVSGTVIANPGSCTERQVFNVSAIPNKTVEMNYLFISFGVNDHFLDNSNVTALQYQTAVEAAIDHAVNIKGWQNRRIIILPIYWTNYDNSTAPNYCFPAYTDSARKAAFVAAAQAAASSRGTNFYNVYQLMANNGGNSLTDDNIHPNNAGYSIIANGLNSYINTSTTVINGKLKSWVRCRKDGTAISGIITLSKTKPKIGIWKQV